MDKKRILSFMLAVSLVIGIALASGCAEGQASREAPAMSVEEIKSTALTISYDELMRHNENYIGEILYFRGEVVQAMEEWGNRYVLRVATKKQQYIGYFEDAIWVNYKGERLLEGDIIDVWGKVKGLKTYRAVLGNQITIPEVNSLHVELVVKQGE